MIKNVWNPYTDTWETVKYGKRYGYWWKQHKKIVAKLIDLQPGVSYFSHLEYKLDKPMSKKHFNRWRRAHHQRPRK